MRIAFFRKAARGLVAAVLCCSAVVGQASDVPYVSTPMHVVDAMLDLGKVGPDDFMIDLGSGDGRISIRAAARFGTRGLGVDLDDNLVRTALADAREQGVHDKVTFEVRNIFDTDISRATIVTAYLLNSVNMRLRPELFVQLKPGTRIVTHDFNFGNWEPDRRLTIDVPDKAYGPPRSDIMLWVVPADFAGVWHWVSPAVAGLTRHVLRFDQKFQVLNGTTFIDGRRLRMTGGRVNGDELNFTLAVEGGSAPAMTRFSGRLSGDSITGQVVVEGGTGAQPWQAKRIQPGKMDISGMDIGGDATLRVANARFTREQ